MQIELSLKQSLQVNPQLLQNMSVLQMSSLELNQYIRQLVQENPAAELVEPPNPVEKNEEFFRRIQNMEELDRQNSPYLSFDQDEWEPLARVGTDGGLGDTLSRHLLYQLDRKNTSPQRKAAVRWLISCLDDDGYLRDEPEDLARDGQLSPLLLEEALSLLRSLDPAGVGAHDLSQCLTLQLERLGEDGPALSIVKSHLEQLGKKQYHAIAQALGISQAQVMEAEGYIRTLHPRPSTGFAGRDTSFYIIPDLTVVEDADEPFVTLQDSFLPRLKISRYYRQLNRETADPEVRQYLTEKLRQTQWAIHAVEQRRSTLLTCAQAIVTRQRDFFRPGGLLAPLCLDDVAQMLDIHPSTVSRAIREKYLECSHGVYPLSFFFSRTAGGEDVSVHQVKALLSQLIREEDPSHPLSDQKLASLLQEQGLDIARRTVAKYRTELGIPSTGGRKKAPL